jgi:hypothetical protein
MEVYKDFLGFIVTLYVGKRSASIEDQPSLLICILQAYGVDLPRDFESATALVHTHTIYYARRLSL